MEIIEHQINLIIVKEQINARKLQINNLEHVEHGKR